MPKNSDLVQFSSVFLVEIKSLHPVKFSCHFGKRLQNQVLYRQFLRVIVFLAMWNFHIIQNNEAIPDSPRCHISFVSILQLTTLPCEELYLESKAYYVIWSFQEKQKFNMCSSSVHAPQCYSFWLQYLQFSLNIHSTELLKPCRKYVKDSSYHKIFYINYHQNKCMNSLNRFQETTNHFIWVKRHQP